MEGGAFYKGLLEALAQGMGTAKGYLFEHGPRTAVLTISLGKRFGLTEEDLADLFFAAVLADLGMIGLVEEAWEDPVPVLPALARAEVESHPLRSAAWVRTIPFLDRSEALIRHHHEWWDGGGYPDHLSGDAIPLGARILRLADTVTALGESRPHRGGRTPDEIREIVARGAGAEFDPAVAELWLDIERLGGIPKFQSGLYRDFRSQAIDTVVPQQVPSPSAGILLELFSGLIDAKDPYTGGHSRRVAHLAASVTRELGFGPEMEVHIQAAGYLHDLGKLSVPSRILRKPGGLALEEREQVRQHARDGALLLEEIPALRGLAPGCRHHHERWDGSGYPEELSGERIPFVARVLGVCDAFDAMTSARAYRPALARPQALAELRDGTGTQFSPREAEVFLSLPVEVFNALWPRAGAVTSPLTPAPKGVRRSVVGQSRSPRA